MAIVTSLAVYNFRSHEAFSFSPSPTTTVITGANGSGKTTLIEAIYIALRGRSFRGSDGDVLMNGTPWWRLELVLDDQKRQVTFDPDKNTKKKQFVVGDKIQARLLEKDKYPVILFEPDDLRLLNGSPSRRRRFIDTFISQINPNYAQAFRRYERALKQRNSLLKKSGVSRDDLFAWDIALSDYGAYIIEQRIIFTEKINSSLTDTYNRVAHSPDTVSVHYSHTLIGDGKQKLLSELHQNLARDIAIGSTTTGPHRHDIIFKFNDSPALSIASRGEVRTILLALKFIEVEITEELTGNKPIILLDDVFSELDPARQEALSSTINSHQIIITSTHTVSDKNKFKQVKL